MGLTEIVVEVAAGVGGGVPAESSVMVNEPFAKGPGDAITLPPLAGALVA